ncbi:MAG: hypothetical protein IJ491_07955 [Clostridia bacterium]|nr:hypothetical protein [Clostridia bacterium]
MSIKKKKEQKKTFGNFYSPYETDDKKTMTEWYEVYNNDPKKMLIKYGRRFSKIIYRCEFYRYEEPTLLVAFEAPDTLCLNDILVDEDGREFTIKGFEMIRYACPIPEWHPIVSNIAIQGEEYIVGDYLSKK